MQKTLLLVDGSSYLYRAFHALPDLRSPDGAPTGAMYGIIAMLRRLRQDYEAAYMACVFDAKGKTFRDDLYAEYKAQRKSMPEDLALQIEPIHEAVRAMGWPILMVDGIEADDVIGTLAVQAAAHGMQTVISTGDKDLAQLVNEQVTLVNTMNNETLDRAGVIAKFGVPPERIVDYLTLVGDTVDNVPGVPKVGPKTAVKWLGQYGSLDGVIANADAIGGAVGANLRSALDWLPQAKVLVTVKTDCDLSAHMQSIAASLTHQPEDRDAMIAFFQRHGFKTWLRDLSGGGTAGGNGKGNSNAKKEAVPLASGADPQGGLFANTEAVAAQYETVLSMAQLEQWIERIERAELTSIDTETTSLDPMTAQLVGLSLSCEVGVAAYIPLAHHYPGAPEQLSREVVLERLRPWLENPAKPKLGQNLKYDSHILANHGVQLRGIVHDTLLQSYVFESHKRHDMDNLALRHLNRKTTTFEEVCGKGVGQICFDAVDIERATEYAAEDADITLQLHQVMWPHVAENDGLRTIYQNIELPTAVVLQKIERNGVLIDAALLAAQSAELGRRMLEIEQQAYELAGQPFNLNSPKQIGEIFFDKLQAAGGEKNAIRLALDRRRGLAKAGRGLSTAENPARLSWPVETEIDLHRQAAKNGQCRHWPSPYELCASGRGHRPAGVERPEPAKHPDPHCRGAPHPRSLYCAGRKQHRVGRLFADRVAHHGPHFGRPQHAARLCRRHRHPSRHCRRNLRRGDRPTSAASSGVTPR